MATVGSESLSADWFVTLAMSGRRIPLAADVDSVMQVKRAVADHLGLSNNHWKYVYVYSCNRDGQMDMLQCTGRVSASDNLYAVVSKTPCFKLIPFLDRPEQEPVFVGRGILSPDGKVYWPPRCAFRAFYMCPDRMYMVKYCYNRIEFDTEYTVGGLLPSTGDIYFAPRQQGRVLRVEPGGFPSFVGPQLRGYQTEPCLGLDGSLYFPPCGANALLRIQPDGTVTTTLLIDNSEHCKGVLSPNGSIYFAPTAGSVVLLIVRPDGSVNFQLLRLPNGMYFNKGGVSNYDNCVYFVGRGAMRIKMSGAISFDDLSNIADASCIYNCDPVATPCGVLVFPPNSLGMFLQCGGRQRRYVVPHRGNADYKHAFIAPGGGKGMLVSEPSGGSEGILRVHDYREDGDLVIHKIWLEDCAPEGDWLSPPTILDDGVIFGPQFGKFFLRLYC